MGHTVYNPISIADNLLEIPIETTIQNWCFRNPPTAAKPGYVRASKQSGGLDI